MKPKPQVTSCRTEHGAEAYLELEGDIWAVQIVRSVDGSEVSLSIRRNGRPTAAVPTYGGLAILRAAIRECRGGLAARTPLDLKPQTSKEG